MARILPRHASNYRIVRSNPFMTHIPFDPIRCQAIFHLEEIQKDNEALSRLLVDSLSRLTPSVDEQQAVATLVTKIVECLESLAMGTSHSNAGRIQEIRVVGSFKKGTMLVGHRTADIVVLLCSQFNLEVVRNIGIFLIEKLSSMNGAEGRGDSLEVIYQPYGFDLEHHDVCVRMTFAVKDSNEIISTEAKNVISGADQRLAHAAIAHARWTEERVAHANVKALIRLLKDLRRRYVGFNHLTPWQIDLLAFHAVMHDSVNAPLSLSAAFRRVIQILAAGLFLPGSAGLIDPCDPQNRRVHVSLTLAQQV